MLSKYGNSVSVCSKLKQAENRLFLQIKFGRILEILWAFLIKQLLHLRFLAVIWDDYSQLISRNAHSPAKSTRLRNNLWNNC